MKIGLKKLYLTGYRTVGFAALASALLALVCYGIVMLFFMVNNTWIAPTVLSSTSKEMLTFSAGYQQAQQTLLTLQVTHDQAVREYDLATKNVDSLTGIAKTLTSYKTGLDRVAPKRQQELHAEQNYAGQLDSVKDNTIKSEGAGLITHTDAVSLLTSASRFQAEATNDGVTWNTTNVQARATSEQVATQLRQAESDVLTKKAMVDAIETSLHTSRQTVLTLEGSVYYRALTNQGNKGAYLVFVGYDTLPNVKAGDGIYDCYLMFVFCKKVGTIDHIFNDEQLVDFPLFNIRMSRTVRGVMAEAKMTHPDSMRSTVLFVGRKPLFF